MAEPWRRGSGPIDGGSPTARAGGDHAWLLPRRPNWNDLMVAYARSKASDSSSGTVSSAYTSSGGSVSYDLASQLRLIELEDDEEKAKKLESAKGLLDVFCHPNGETRALEMWFSEMGVGWVLGLGDDASAGTSLLRGQQGNLSERWVRALTEITESISTLRKSLRSFHLEPFVQLVRFAEATVQKMLPFVDALLAASDLDASNGAQAPSAKLQTLLYVREALSSASEGIQLCFDWESSVEIEAGQQRISYEVVSLLSAKEHRLDEAIWNTMEEVRTSILTSTNDDDDTEWGTQTPQGSSDICTVTRSLMTYIKSLWNNYWLLNHVVRKAVEPCNISRTGPFTRLTMDMVSSLEEKLARRSESIPDHSLRFLYLINNTHFIWQQLHPLFGMKFHMAVLTSRIEDYIQKYLQVSWVPVLSCLYNQTPHCFRTNSVLPRFDSEFQKTYTAQMLWKVPDPELRTRLREAIVEKVVSALTEYLEDGNITSPGVTLQEREKMLLELFEG